MAQFLGTTLPKIVRSDLRSISSDSADVSKFIKKAYDHLEENKTFHLYQDFLLDADLSATPWELANKIDSLIGQAFQCAEKTCAQPQRTPWSIKLHKASRKVRFWKTALTQRRTGVSQKSVLAEIGGSVWSPAIPFIPTNERSLISVGRAAKKALKRIRKIAKNERADHLRTHRERLALRVMPKDKAVADAIKTIYRQLTNQHMFGRIQAAVKPLSSAALTKVQLANESMHVHPITGQEVKLQQVQTIDTKLELEAAIIEQNKHHFAQAQGTSFTQPPLSHIGSSNGYNIFHGDAGNDIVLPNSALVETQIVLDILRDRSKLPPPSWSAAVSFDEFVSALLHWRESTVTSPSGRHLGMYRSLVTAYCDSSGEFSKLPDDIPDLDSAPNVNDGASLPAPPTDTQEMAASILQLIYGLAMTAARLGVYLQRWTQVVNVMIYKKPGCIEFDKLRVIHLFEADFNLLVGLFFGRRAASPSGQSVDSHGPVRQARRRMPGCGFY
jgi:hypothetical protein